MRLGWFSWYKASIRAHQKRESQAWAYDLLKFLFEFDRKGETVNCQCYILNVVDIGDFLQQGFAHRKFRHVVFKWGQCLSEFVLTSLLACDEHFFCNRQFESFVERSLQHLWTTRISSLDRLYLANVFRIIVYCCLSYEVGLRTHWVSQWVIWGRFLLWLLFRLLWIAWEGCSSAEHSSLEAFFGQESVVI
jgi:hypothetical protein